MTQDTKPTEQPRDNLPAPAPGTIRDLLKTERVKQAFADVLRDKAPQFIASLANMVYASKQLRACEPYTVISAALKAAVLDLPIEPSLGFAAIVPYKEQAQFQMQWKGYIQLAHRSSQYANIHVTEVYEGMVKGYDPFTGTIHKGEKTSGKVVGYYAYFKLVNGFEKEDYMTIEEVQAHGQKYSKTYGNQKSAWHTNPDAMGRKTILKRLLTRWGVLSVDMQKAVAAEVPPEEAASVIVENAPPENGNGKHESETGGSDEFVPDSAAIDAALEAKRKAGSKALYGDEQEDPR